MGKDKALLAFQGRPMVEIAVEKLRSFCAAVSVSGNRDDLGAIAPVVSEARVEMGPAAGIEAGLKAATESWALFVPVDVPGAPEAVLRTWAETVLSREPDGVRLSFLRANGERQPSFCMLHRDCLPALTQGIDVGVLKLGELYGRVGDSLGPATVWIAEAESFLTEGTEKKVDTGSWFSNVNTPEDLLALQLWIRKLSPAG